MFPAVPASEWTQRCADRLRRQWPRVPTADLEDTARELLADHRLRQMSPEAAAVEWLRRGVLIE